MDKFKSFIYSDTNGRSEFLDWICSTPLNEIIKTYNTSATCRECFEVYCPYGEEEEYD